MLMLFAAMPASPNDAMTAVDAMATFTGALSINGTVGLG